MRNNIRFDLSEYLIHFFRDVNLDSNNYILFPDHCGFNNLNYSLHLDARFLLRCSIRHHKICSSWSIRGGARTIYGNSPAVCLTEMPIPAFIKTSIDRIQRGENIGQYALVFPKNQMFAAGARPVIYGLANVDTNLPPSNGGGRERIIHPSLLALEEQFRYVTYNPSSQRPIDWTHEREWRWPCREGNNFDFSEQPDDLESYPGFDFSKVDLTGCGVIVPSSQDISRIIFDILTLVDRRIIMPHTFSFVLPMDRITSYTNIVNPTDLSICINQNVINIGQYFELSESEINTLDYHIASIIENESSNYTAKTKVRERGRAWVWIVDNQPDVTRALVSSQRITVSKEGRYLLDLGWSNVMKDLRDQEEIAKRVASKIAAEFNINCSYFSVLNSSDINAVPFYTDFLDEAHEFYNVTKRVD